MLAEFALTPAVFDEDAHEDKDAWLEQLRELGANMFPKVAPSPVMVSDLYAGSWYNEVVGIVRGIRHQGARVLCQGLLKKVENALVFRPVARKDWPGEDECAWGREAIESSRYEPIDRIVATERVREVLREDNPLVRCIGEVLDSGFWAGISISQHVPMRITDQSTILRKICLHAEFLCLLTPHIYGGSDDETDFAIEVIRSATHRPAGYHPVGIDIHTSGPKGNPGDPDYAVKLSSSCGNMTRRLCEALKPGDLVRLFIWPKLLDRFLVGGVFVETADGSRRRSPRWGVSMPHIARVGDEAKSHRPTSWSLLDNKALYDCFDTYFKENATGMLPGSPIVIEG